MVTFCREKGKTLTIALHVQPRARKTEIIGVHGDALKIKVAAPPVDGAANEEIVRYFAKLLDVTKSKVSIAIGGTSKRKVIEVVGVTVTELTSILIRNGLLTIQLG